MITNYYTLHALVREWTPDLVGCVVADAFSQARDELTLALASPTHEWMLQISVRRAFQYVFRNEGYSKARRNVATLFEEAFDRRVTALRLAEHDRVLFLDLEGGFGFQIQLFGSRANVLLTTPDGRIRDAFQDKATWVGQPAPPTRPAPLVPTFEAFNARWRTDRKTTAQALAAALPLFDRTLAAETLHRAKVTTPKPADCAEAERRALFAMARALQADLENPTPCLYWQGRFAEAFSLVPLHHLQDDLEEEPFDTVDAAVRVFVRRRLGQERFRAAYAPLEKALASAAQHFRTSTERMLGQLTEASRADRYERWGHLLMAAATSIPPQADTVTLPDLFASNEPLAIPLDPLRSAIENAERYYEKARQNRQARLHAEDRLLAAEARADEAEALLTTLRQIDKYADLERFRKAEAKRLAPFLPQDVAVQRIPFRRFPFEDGYEVWVGKSAKQNDLLTFRYARKYDLWLHARGVGGSHTLLRLPHRQARPGKLLLARAASIAAYYSKAKGSGLVPVIVTERKYVRKPKGAAPGAVLVEREEVLIVEPKLPV